MAAYYNEIDPFAAAWLRNLIGEGLIADGDVDERSIADVDAADLRSFDQCHFFAGIGGWSYALRLAGWPDDRPVWTGSCPCQPFSVAGKGKGTADERHLWPEFHRLIGECRPAVVFGEQVASKAGREWLSGVFTDLENVGYAGAGADLCAPGVGAPHIRQRLYWVATDMADAASQQEHEEQQRPSEDERRRGANGAGRCGLDNRQGDMADAESQREPSGSIKRSINSGGGLIMDGPEPWGDGVNDGEPVCDVADADVRSCGKRGVELRGQTATGEPCVFGQDDVGNADGSERAARDLLAVGDEERPECFAQPGSCGDMGDADDAGRQGRVFLPERADERAPWSHGVEWRRGADGKERRVKSGVRLLVDGVPNRVGRLRGYGNAIVPQVAAAFVSAIMEGRQ